MEQIYARLRDRTHQIAARCPVPDFYKEYSLENGISKRLFETDPLITALKRFVSDYLEDDFGHGMAHSEKVTIDAGTLMFIEGKQTGYTPAQTERRVILVHCAGLLHDIKRKHKDHAALGAGFAREVLEDFAFLPDEIDDICTAIRNHEAFKKTVPAATPAGTLVSDCLYDADKFRWGPDNFKHTLWDMVLFFKPTLADFIKRYPQGMEGIVKIKDTFRTITGKRYGPDFIDIGIAIGDELLKVIMTEFASDI